MPFITLRLIMILSGVILISFGLVPEAKAAEVMILVGTGSWCLFIASMRSVDISAVISFYKFFYGNSDNEPFNVSTRAQKKSH